MTPEPSNQVLSIAGRDRVLDRPILMGIVNVTPDSFSDGGEFLDPDRAVDHAGRLVGEGADWLDIGGESTRPGAEAVGVDEELRRVLPVLDRLAGRVDVPISIDTTKPQVAREALARGVTILNDVTGFRDPLMVEIAAGSDAACIVMHMLGTPATMHEHARYDDLIGELVTYFRRRFDELDSAGVATRRLVVDPGIGFSKKHRHNVEVLARLAELKVLGRPILIGPSRKRIVGELTGRGEPERVHGTIGAVLAGYARGARIFRVHDVAAVRDALAVFRAIDSAAHASG